MNPTKQFAVNVAGAPARTFATRPEAEAQAAIDRAAGANVTVTEVNADHGLAHPTGAGVALPKVNPAPINPGLVHPEETGSVPTPSPIKP